MLERCLKRVYASGTLLFASRAYCPYRDVPLPDAACTFAAGGTRFRLIARTAIPLMNAHRT